MTKKKRSQVGVDDIKLKSFDQKEEKNIRQEYLEMKQKETDEKVQQHDTKIEEQQRILEEQRNISNKNIEEIKQHKEEIAAKVKDLKGWFIAVIAVIAVGIIAIFVDVIIYQGDIKSDMYKTIERYENARYDYYNKLYNKERNIENLKNEMILLENRIDNKIDSRILKHIKF